MTTHQALSGRALEAMGPAFGRRAGPLLEPLVTAVCSELDDVDALLALVGKGWPRVFDLDSTPYPGWLGATTGTRAPRGLGTEETREYVRRAPQRRRGRPEAIAAAVATLLTGSRAVGFIERDGTPDHLRVLVLASETSATVEQLTAAALLQKPTGILFSTVQMIASRADAPAARWYLPDVERVSYAAMSLAHPTYLDFAEAFPTYADATNATTAEGEG